MTRIFRIDFYPHEWLTLTSHMTPEQKGVFIDIVAMIYAKRGAIKNDPNHFGRVSNCSSRMAKSIVQQLLDQNDLQHVGEGFITQKRCESELNMKLTHLEHSAKGGRKSSEIKQQSIKNNDLNSSDDENSLSSSTLPQPHPTPNNKRENKEFSLFPETEKIAKKNKRATSLPDDWKLPIPWGEWAMREENMTRDEIIKQARTFHDWAIANGAVKKNWEAAWRNWIRRSAQFKPKEYAK